MKVSLNRDVLEMISVLLSTIILVAVVTPATAEAGRLLTAGSAHKSAAVSVCSDAGDGWTCAEQPLHDLSGAPLAAESIHQDRSHFRAWDADSDGISGFVTWGEHTLSCEPDAAGKWRCAELVAGSVAETQVLDFDGDDIEDLLLYVRDQGARVCHGGTFPIRCAPIDAVPAGPYQGFAWADYDGDGSLDVFLACDQPGETGASQLCLAVKGHQCATLPSANPPEPAARCFNTDAAAFHANDDDHFDLYIESDPEQGGRDSALCLGAGDSSFDCSAVDLPDLDYRGEPWGEGSTDITIADMDGDGREDLVMGSRAEPFVCWNDGAGAEAVLDCRFLDGADSKDLEWGVLKPAVADLGGDGWLDVVYNQATGLTVCTNSGDRGFTCIATEVGFGHSVAYLEGAEPEPPPDSGEPEPGSAPDGGDAPEPPVDESE